MKQLLAHRWLYITLAVITIGFVISMLVRANNAGDQLLTAQVERGAVQQLVSVSGVAQAEQTAQLAFPTGGIVAEVLVEEGQEVVQGERLLALDVRALQADRQDAAAALAGAVASRNELIAGPREEALQATNEQVKRTQDVLITTEENQVRIIKNARRTLLSSGLEAQSEDSREEATPPTITGTYICDSEGTYTLQVFRSGARSGYSYNLSGLEFDTGTVFTEQSAPLGDCGLRIQFDASSNYSNSVWIVEIPNTASASYTTNQNTYTLAQTNAASTITLAEQDLAVAIANQTNTNAPARQEAIARANADVAAAQARLARIDATLADRTLTAPFAGMVSKLDILPGETVDTNPVVTLIADGDFELTARIPEIDIGKLLVGQSANVTFDARANETLTAAIEYIAFEATEIDGVAYYEARLKLETEPVWLRSGLNADIDIIINESTDALRIPKRFISINGNEGTIRTRVGEDTASTTVGIELVGNDGFVAITGVTEGEVLVAP